MTNTDTHFVTIEIAVDDTLDAAEVERRIRMAMNSIDWDDALAGYFLNLGITTRESAPWFME